MNYRSSNDLPLRDAVGGIDVVHAALILGVALMNAVDSNEAEAVLRRRSPAHGDSRALGVRPSLRAGRAMQSTACD
jgi:hypothetical protein